MSNPEIARAQLVLETVLDEAALLRSASRAAGSISRILAAAGVGAGSGVRPVQQLTAAFGQLATKAGPAGVAVAAVAAAVVVTAIAVPKLTKAIVNQAQAASNLQESLNAIRVILGGAADSFLLAFKNSEKFGLSQNRLNTAIAPMAALLRNNGFEGAALAQNLELLTRRAIDLSSVFNVEVETVLERLQAAIRGEIRSVEALGISFNDNSVQARALALGYTRLNGEFNESAKVQARLSLIVEQSAFATGDFAKTSTTLANAQRTLRSTVEDLRAEISAQFLPAAQSITQTLIELAEDVGPDIVSFFVSMKPLIDAVAVGFRIFGDVIDVVTESVKFLGNSFLKTNPLLRIGVKIVGELAERFLDTGEKLEAGLDKPLILMPELVNVFDIFNEVLKDTIKSTDSAEKAQKQLDNIGKSLAKGTKELNELFQERNRLLQELPVRNANELADALDRQAEAGERLRDLDQQRADILRQLEELQTPATEEEKERAAIGLERAKNNLADIEAELLALGKEQNKQGRISIDLTGLTLDQIRTKLAGVRAERAAQQGANDGIDTAAEIEEKRTELELDRRDAVLDLKDAEDAQLKVENKVLDNADEIRELNEDLVELARDRASALRDQAGAERELAGIRAGDTAANRELATLNERITAAQERQGELAASRLEAQQDLNEALLETEATNTRIADFLQRNFGVQNLDEINAQIQAGSFSVARQLITSLIPNISSFVPPGGFDAFIRRVIEAMLNTPGTDLSKILRDLGVPGYKSGALVTSPTLARIGEQFKPELVLPLTRPDRVWSLLSANLPKFPGALAAAQSAVATGHPAIKMPTSGIPNRRGDGMSFDQAEEIIKLLRLGGTGSITVEAPITVSSPVQDPKYLARKLEQRITRRFS